MIDIQNLDFYKEDNRLEAKRAKSQLPDSIWETYSAFANPGDIRIGLKAALSGSIASGIKDLQNGIINDTKELTERQQVIVNFIRKVAQSEFKISSNETLNEPLTIPSISKALSINISTLKREMATLQKAGIIKR